MLDSGAGAGLIPRSGSFHKEPKLNGGHAMKIKVLRNTSAGCNSLSEGQILNVPADISEENAGILVRMGKAAIVPPEEPKETGSVKEETTTPAVESGTTEEQ